MNPIFALGGTMFVMITVMIIYGRCGGNIQKRRYIGLNTRAKATTISVSYISIGRIIIFILLDIGAMVVRELHVDPQVQSIYHEGNFGDLNDIIYNIPVTLLVFDGIALFAGLLMVITALCFTSTCTCMCSRCYTCSGRCKRRYKDCCYYPLVLTVVPLIFSAYSHAPYIIMAYVSDTSYASSIFIYYVIAIFVEFGVLEYTFSTLFKKWKKWKILIFILALALSVFINGTMASIITFFFFAPIKYALRRAPSEVLVIYQSAIIFVGGYITYKTVFKDKRSHQEKLNSDISLLDHSKMKEIAALEHEITQLQHVKDENGDEDGNNNQHIKAEIDFLWRKISHLRVEYQLQSLHNRFISTLDYPVNLFVKESIINDLYTQQYKLLSFLSAEITNMNNEDQKKYLQVEVLTHLKNILAQFWREPHRSRKSDKFNNTDIQTILNDLPEMTGDLETTKQQLKSEYDQIKILNTELEPAGQEQPLRRQLLELQQKQENLHQEMQQLQVLQQQQLEQLKKEQQQLQQQLQQQHQLQQQQQQLQQQLQRRQRGSTL